MPKVDIGRHEPQRAKRALPHAERNTLAVSALVAESTTRHARVSPSPSPIRYPGAPRTIDRPRIVARAERFAERRHRGEFGRDRHSPYFDHVAAVVALIDETGASSRMLCAAYLHDVVEHTPTTIEEIRDRFGVRVAALVSWMTIPTHNANGSPLTWAEQKHGALERAGERHREALWLKAADLCANSDELLRNYARCGPLVWAQYEATPARQLGYYLALADVLQPQLDSATLAAHVATRRRRLVELAADAGIVPSFRRTERRAGASRPVGHPGDASPGDNTARCAVVSARPFVPHGSAPCATPTPVPAAARECLLGRGIPPGRVADPALGVMPDVNGLQLALLSAGGRDEEANPGAAGRRVSGTPTPARWR